MIKQYDILLILALKSQEYTKQKEKYKEIILQYDGNLSIIWQPNKDFL
jgi:hypothetical protein